MKLKQIFVKIEPKNLTKTITFYSEKNESIYIEDLNKQSSEYKTFILDISAVGMKNKFNKIYFLIQGISLIDSFPREILHVNFVFQHYLFIICQISLENTKVCVAEKLIKYKKPGESEEKLDLYINSH